MQFTISKAALQRELGFVQAIVERKTTIPTLSMLLIESAGGDKIRISGTDLDVTIRCEVEAAEVVEEGAMCVPARKLFDIVRLAPDALISIATDKNDWVNLKCDKAKFKLPSIARDGFPELPVLRQMPISIPAGTMQLFIQRTIFAITQEESRYTLSGAKFIVKPGSTLMITTDGHRLAYMESKSGEGNADVLIPKKALSEVAKLAAEIKFDEMITFGHDENHVFFQAGTRSLISRLLVGQFPNYEMVLPKGNDRRATVDGAALNQTLRRAALMADNRSHAIRLNFAEGEIEVSAQTPEEGEATEALPAEFSGQPIPVGFNADYLRDFLDVVGPGKVAISLKDSNTQTELQPATGEVFTYRYIVMPMRL